MTQKWIEPGDVRLGRTIVDHDERNLDFPMRGAFFDPEEPLRDRTWRRGEAYDQGQTSQCVAFTGKGILNSAPISSLVPYSVRRKFSTQEFYDGAQLHDQWPGVGYDGTSARGLMRYLSSVGLVKEYRWCFGLQDVLATLAHYGPVALGVNWYESMFYPKGEDGLLSVEGPVVGGHEVELIGLDISEHTVIGMNSWGEEWGDRGRFRLSWVDLDRLLKEDGDAVTVTK